MIPGRHKVAIVGSGPAGLSAAAHAAELGLSHVLLEAESWLSNTIHRYQKGKHVMAEPAVLPLRSPLPFAAGKREGILQGWNDGVRRLGVNLRQQARVGTIQGGKGAFTLTLADNSTIHAEAVVLAIGLQGNLRKLGCPGEDLDWVQYQLDDPDEYRNECIVVVGAGDAAIENALALSANNKVYILNRRDEFDRAKPGNLSGILKAIEDGRITCLYNTRPVRADNNPGAGSRGLLRVATADGESELACDRIIARLGATPPRAFVESCGVSFPNADPNSVPAVSPHYESNVPGLYIIGALAGFPLIKQAMNQGYEVIEFIEGRNVEPADAPLLRQKFAILQEIGDIDKALETVRRRVPILSTLTPLQLREFMIDSEILAPPDGETIFAKNDYSDTFFSVVSGEVEVQPDPADPTKVFRLGKGEFFGEMSLISGRRRSATVRAVSKAVLIETPRRSMNKLINSVAAVKRVIDEVFMRRIIQARIAPTLHVDEISDLVASAEVRQYRPGEILFKEGDAGDALYLVRKGSITISREINGRDVVLAYVPAGQYVGEMALVSDLPRSATARAAVAAEAIRLDGGAFKALMLKRTHVRDRVQDVYRMRVAQNVVAQSKPVGDVLEFMMSQGLGEATDVLLIDEALCVRCDHCEKACADTHGNVSRLKREAGPTFNNLHVPTSCRHCEHPHCMKDCPPDAIQRSPNGEVHITDACIGCGNCERNCPYGVIQMGVQSKEVPSLWRWMMFGGDEPGRHQPKKDKTAAKKAAKCDMCKDLDGGPACVRACPTGAAMRASPEQFVQLYRRGH